MRLRFDGLAAPVEFHGCDALLDRLGRVTRGWTWRPADETDGLPACIDVTATGEGWRIRSRWLDRPIVYADAADILCALLADLVMAYIETDAHLLCLHAGAARIGDGDDAPLIVFPAQAQAGKSTLSAALAVAGARLYADDALPIDLGDSPRGGPGGGEALAIGLAPRPRLPLPERLPATLRAAILERIAVANGDYGYVALEAGRLAPRGERGRIAAFVRLERTDGAAALIPESRSEIMKILLWQNFGARPPAAEMVARFAALIAGAECLRLRYRDIEEAVDILKAHGLAMEKDARRRAAGGAA